jgi:CSLREA domain-containing protein
MEERTLLSGFTVSNTDDSGPGSLRQAILDANAQSGGNDITFDPTAFASAQTITLTSGQLELSNTSGTETITGPAAGVTVDAAGASRVFQVDANVTASISGLTITGGNAGYNNSGGGVLDYGTATLTDCTITANSAVYGFGGGVANQSGTVNLIDCTITGNSALRSLFGQAGRGGGVSTGGGHGSKAGATTTLTNCTVSGNSALMGNSFGGNYGGGVYNKSTDSTILGNTIVAGNTGGSSPDVNGGITSQGNNLIGDKGTSTGWLGSDLTGTSAAPLVAVLAPQGNYGGPTQTMALLPGSPALGAGNNALIPAGVTTDGRGFNRIVSGTVDIGAFESSGFSIAVTSGSGQTASGVFPAPLVVTVTANNPIEPVAGGLVTFTPPASGASAVLTGNPVTLSASGTASVTATSNAVGGSYTVSATASGAPAAASFSLSNVALASIAVTPGNSGNPELAAGVAGQFTATGTFADHSTQDITDLVNWASATPSVATISGTGLATALVPGTSVITASVGGVTSPADTLTVIAPSYVVNTTADDFGFSNGTTSLRDAIAGANAHPGQTISFDPTVFATAQTITLSLGQLELSNTSGTETITGPAAGVTLSAGVASRVFQVDSAVTASISGLTITGGNSGNSDGGGVRNYGTTTLTNCTISGNSASSGGGVFNEYGTVNLIECTVSGNQATGAGTSDGGNGGGVYNKGGTANLLDCTVSDNSTGSHYGYGGGVATTGAEGGATTLTNCTVSDNSAYSGGGVANRYYDSTTLGNTIVAGNTASGIVFTNPPGTRGPDVADTGGIISQGNNLIGETDESDGWVGSDLTGTEAAPLVALLAPLGNFGGPTQTMPLLPGSPAIDAGNNALIPAGVTTDGRGFNRIVSGTVDIGAFESSGFTIALTSGSGQTASGAFPAPLVATVTANNPIEPVAGGLVTFTPPASGASAVLTGNPATLSASGTASITAASNAVGGSYAVSATASGAPGAASFSLTNVALVSIAVSPGNPELAPSVAGQFTATGTFADHSTQDLTDLVTWASATPTVATISGTGLATALVPGQSVITASVGGVTSPADTLTVIAPSYVVNTTADDFGFSNGTTSLREAIAGANAHPGQTITFDPTVFASAQTITLSLGQLELSNTTGTTTISGPAASVTVSAGGGIRVFQVDSGVTTSISGLTITGGRGNNFGFGQGGGGLANYGGNLTLTDCTVSGNAIAGGDGGGLDNKSGTANLIDCTFSDNSAFYGAAIYSRYSTTTLTDCIISGNSGFKGAVEVRDGSTVLTGCTVSGNTASEGAGLYNSGATLTLTNCTVSGNTASENGGGLDNRSTGGGTATTTLTNCTVSGNFALQGGGVYSSAAATYVYAGILNLGNTIIAGNTASTGPDVSGGVSSQGNNLICETDGSSGWVASDLTGTIAAPLDAVLAPLGNYGGPTETLALLPGSPAIDAGNNALIPDGITTDGRGSSGIVSGTVDIGAFESSGFTIALTSGSGQTAGVFPGPLVVTVTANNPIEPVAGGLVTFTPLGSGASADLTGNPASLSASGTASVTATSNGFAGSYTVVALANGVSGVAAFSLTNVAVVSIAVSPGNPELAVGVAGQFTAMGTFSDGSTGDITPFVTWASDTPTVATISDTGVASALALGTSAITASLAGVTGPADTLTVIAPSFVVNTTADDFGFSNGTTSLREAIAGANAVPGQTITFDPTVFASAKTITLSLGQLELSDTGGTETITGPAAGVTLSAGGASRVIQVDSGVTASIAGLTITGGSGINGGGLANYGGTATLTNCTVSGNTARNNGGGLYITSSGTTTLTNCTVSGNIADNNGGGLYVNNYGAATLTNCTVSGDTAGTNGGGLNSSGTLTLTNCTVSENSAKYDGGGLNNEGTATLNSCTISNNSATTFSGGGLYSSGGTLRLTNCTVSGNTAGSGGGGLYVNNNGTLTLTNCTVTENSAKYYGGGIDTNAQTTLGNTIVAGNTSPGGPYNSVSGPDVYSGNSGSDSFTSQGTNLIGKTDGSSGWVASDLTGTIAAPLDAMLGPIGNYGGPTQTLGLLPGSPAIDAGNNALVPSGVTTDQRGTGDPRIVNGTVDIGAFEFGGSTGESQSISFGALANQTYGASPVALTATASSNLPVSFAIISGPATISGSTLTITGAGNVVVEARQGGNDVFAPAVSVDESFTVNTVTLTILPNAGQSKVYGAAVPGLTETATGFVNGDTASLLTGALGTSATSSSAVGTYAFTLGSLSAGPNYTLVLAVSPPSLAVTRAPLSIQPNAGQSKVYGAAVPGLTETATGFVNGDTASLLTGALGTSATASSAVGTYAFTLGSLSAGPNYTLALAASPPTFAVTKAPLAILPDSGQSKVYGAAVPGVTATATGFVNGDSASLLTGTLGTMATASSVVGTYAFTVGSLSAGPNYNVVLATSSPTFAVTKAPLAIQPNAGQSKVYGTAVPGLTETATGFVNGDSASLLTGALGTVATASSAVGTYGFTLGSLSAGPNYTLVLAVSPPAFAVTPASLVITANSASITSGQALPVLTASYAGFENGDTSASLTTPPTLSTTAGTGSPAGAYPITASGAGSPNYTITYMPGTLTVALPLATVKSVSIQKIKLSKHKTVQGIVLQFNEALNSATAQSITSYTLATVPKNKKQKSVAVALSSAAYSASAFTVTLLTRKTLALNPPLALTVKAASLMDALGRKLDGNHSGQPGANFTAVLSKAGATVTSARERARIGSLSSHAVDAVLAAGFTP